MNLTLSNNCCTSQFTSIEACEWKHGLLICQMICSTYFADVPLTCWIGQILPENTLWNEVLKQFFILHRRLSLDLIKNPVHSAHMLLMCPPCSSRLDPVCMSLNMTFKALIMIAIHWRIKWSFISDNIGRKHAKMLSVFQSSLNRYYSVWDVFAYS